MFFWLFFWWDFAWNLITAGPVHGHGPERVISRRTVIKIPTHKVEKKNTKIPRVELLCSNYALYFLSHKFTGSNNSALANTGFYATRTSTSNGDRTPLIPRHYDLIIMPTLAGSRYFSWRRYHTAGTREEGRTAYLLPAYKYQPTRRAKRCHAERWMKTEKVRKCASCETAHSHEKSVNDVSRPRKENSPKRG